MFEKYNAVEHSIMEELSEEELDTLSGGDILGDVGQFFHKIGDKVNHFLNDPPPDNCNHDIVFASPLSAFSPVKFGGVIPKGTICNNRVA